MRANFENKKKILCFSGKKKLIGIFSSYREIERLMGFKHSCIQRACSGAVVSAYNHYWRELPSDVIVESDDLDVLDLVQYDLEVLGKDRLVYETVSMGRGRKTVNISKIAKRKNL